MGRPTGSPPLAHLRRTKPQEIRKAGPGCGSLPQPVPPLRTPGSAPEQGNDAGAARIRPEKGHGGERLDRGGLHPGVRPQLPLTTTSLCGEHRGPREGNHRARRYRAIRNSSSMGRAAGTKAPERETTQQAAGSRPARSAKGRYSGCGKGLYTIKQPDPGITEKRMRPSTRARVEKFRDVPRCGVEIVKRGSIDKMEAEWYRRS